MVGTRYAPRVRKGDGGPSSGGAVPAPKQVVRQGYDRISHAYRDDQGAENTNYGRWLARHLLPRLHESAHVLDLGCGNGIPTARLLAEHHTVIGVDLSEVQIARARRLVPRAEFVVADMSLLDFPPASFDAVVSFFAIIHVPLDEQPSLFARIGRWLRPGGVFLGTLGHTAWTGTGDFHGAPMYWSHADAATYRRWLEHAGVEVVEREFIPEGDGGHELMLGVRSPGAR
jgi:SAM-dependent methyltransferase